MWLTRGFRHRQLMPGWWRHRPRLRSFDEMLLWLVRGRGAVVLCPGYLFL